MNLNIERLTKTLEGLGFHRVRQEADGSLHFANALERDGIFDWFSVTVSGQQRQNVLAWAVISVVRRAALVKGLGVSEVMCNVATNRNKCSTLIIHDGQSFEWEQRLTANLSDALESLRIRCQDDVLSRTATARASIGGYFARIPSNVTDWYAGLPVTGIKMRAREIANGPICQLAENRALCENAIFILLSYGSMVEGIGYSFDTFRPFEAMDEEVIWRIELLIDNMLRPRR